MFEAELISLIRNHLFETPSLLYLAQISNYMLQIRFVPPYMHCPT